MKSVVFSAIAGAALVCAMTGPALAADFPEQPGTLPCELLTNLPFDFTLIIPPATADKLAAQIADACDF